MRKYVSLAFMAIVLSLGFTSCSVETSEEPGGTNVQKMAGRWNVKVDVVDGSGNVVFAAPYEIGTITIFTYNTADNSATQMWLDDRKEFWNFKMKVDVNYEARTFSCAAKNYNAAGTGTAEVTGGRILENAARNLHGMPNDSIVFDIKFSDDDYGRTFRFSGQRYTGFYE